MRFVGYDVETWGEQPQFALQPFRSRAGTARLTSFALSTQAGDFAHLWPDKDRLGAALTAVADTGATVVGWNTPFDAAWAIALGLKDLVMRIKWADAQLLGKHLHQRPTTTLGQLPWGLKHWVEQTWPERAGYADDIDFNDLTAHAMGKLLTYNKRDASYTRELAETWWEQMSWDQRRCAEIEAEAIPLVAETLVEGIKADVEAAQALAQRLDEKATVAFAQLVLQNPGEVSKAVLASPKQLRELLYDKWKLPVLGLTDTGQASTERDVLLQLAFEDPRAALINTVRESLNNRTKFCVGIIASANYNGDGCSRPVFRIAGTYTGRGSYSSKTGKGVAEVPTGIALHQWRNDKDFRNIIQAPDGYEIIEADFAGQEYRWMGVESGDETILSMCMPGEDGHAFLGARIHEVDYRHMLRMLVEEPTLWAPKRKFGKVGNLSCQYRTSPPTLVKVARTQHKMDLALSHAQVVVKTYKQTYPKVPKYWRAQIAKGRRQGFVETLAGRRLHIGFDWPEDKTWGLESSCINFPIQGVGADQKYLALKALKAWMPRHDARFYFELHDGMFIVAPKAKAERAAHEMKYLLSNLPYEQAWGARLPIQFPVDVKMGPRWGSMTEVM